jgi:xanthine dehydrogenase accessory factor
MRDPIQALAEAIQQQQPAVLATVIEISGPHRRKSARRSGCWPMARQRARSAVVLIATDRISDEAALRQVITSPLRYVGMIGSRAKCQTILDHLRADGITAEALDRVYAPIGLELGGTSPQEIAVAILAEIIAVRRGGRGAFRSR